MAYLGLETIRRGNSAECIKDIFTLHFPEAKTIIDATYGSGRFWNWDHHLKVYGVDIDLQQGCSVKANYLKLPFAKFSCDVLCFDPPFIFNCGINRIMGTKRFFTGSESVNVDQRRWSKQEIFKPKNPKQLLRQTEELFQQRNIATQGIILKGQDLIASAPDWWMFNVMMLAKDMGMGMPADILIQHSKSFRMRDPRWKNQYHFRRSHCYYLIYKFQ